MRLLILQHAATEHAGRFRQMLAREGISTTALVVPDITDWPTLDTFDALWVLGGAAQVWQSDLYPWLAPEIAFIRTAIDAQKPYFGICLGHQLLAVAMGGTVGLAQQAEIGILPFDLSDPALKGALPDSVAVQWHAAEVRTLPDGFHTIASSPNCAVQAMRGSGAALSVQFHPEIDSAAFADWMSGPGARDDLCSALGTDAEARFLADINENEDRLARLAQALLGNWLADARAAL
ncbi:type 1 glutamine amidotransferase [Shimia biformata]|uniref:type 1 glutamine amidotransferase n=1 Tax=Shimia biformata TaxID=1294299 RepID=UPI001951B7AD|nr:type 1 glutamine amidotransferase [Shimia biformata]